MFILENFVLSMPNSNNTEPYNRFFIRYYQSQLFHNFFSNILIELEANFEEINKDDWDKNFPTKYFEFPFKQSLLEVENNELENIKKYVKNKLNLTKDYYFIEEILAFFEFIELFSMLEVYFRDIYELLFTNNKKLQTEKLKLTNEEQNKILNMIILNESLDISETEKIITDSIKKHVKSYFISKPLSEIVKNIIENLLREDIKNNFYNEISNYEEILVSLGNFQHLRNLHIHDLGVENEEYKNLSGIYGVDKLRGLIAKLVPITDKYINEQIKRN